MRGRMVKGEGVGEREMVKMVMSKGEEKGQRKRIGDENEKRRVKRIRNRMRS